MCLLGSFGVGKTSLVRRYVYNLFEEKYLSTIGVQISQKLLSPIANPTTGRLEQLNLILWDLAHLEQFDQVIKKYFHGAHGAIIVYDLTRPETIESLNEIKEAFLEAAPSAKPILVANKLDLSKNSQELLKTGRELAETLDSECIATSAKTGENVEEMFGTLAHKLLW